MTGALWAIFILAVLFSLSAVGHTKIARKASAWVPSDPDAASKERVAISANAQAIAISNVSGTLWIVFIALVCVREALPLLQGQ